MWFNDPYTTLTMVQMWKNAATFIEDYNNIGTAFSDDAIDEDELKRIYYLLVSRYGNNPLANNDIGQAKLKIFSTLNAYYWEYARKAEVQKTIRNLSEDDLLIGAKQIYNRALNPNSTPSTDSLEELTYINEQNTSNHKKSRLEAYSILWNMLNSEYTTEFLSKFKNCFAVFVDKMPAPFYITDKDYLDEE